MLKGKAQKKQQQQPNHYIACISTYSSPYVKMSFCFPFKQQASKKFNDTHKIYTLQRHNIDVLMCFNKIYLIINLNK